MGERLTRTLPAARETRPEGDFRNWEDIEAWARQIGAELDDPSRG